MSDNFCSDFRTMYKNNCVNFSNNLENLVRWRCNVWKYMKWEKKEVKHVYYIPHDIHPRRDFEKFFSKFFLFFVKIFLNFEIWFWKKFYLIKVWKFFIFFILIYWIKVWKFYFDFHLLYLVKVLKCFFLFYFVKACVLVFTTNW